MSDVYIYGRDFNGSPNEFLEFLYNQNFDKPPYLVLDSNIAGRYTNYKNIIEKLPVDIITIFSEIEKSVNTKSELVNSPFETLPNSKNLNKIKKQMVGAFNNMFNKNIIKSYIQFMNKLPKLKGLSNLKKTLALTNYYNSYRDKKIINFYILLGLININLNCDHNDLFRKLLHFPQEKYTEKNIRNFLFDLFIIDEINRFSNEGYNIFFCTGDEGAYNLCNYITSLTLIISNHSLNINFSDCKLYGIEKTVYRNIEKDNNFHEIISEIRKNIYKYWTGKKNQPHQLRLNKITILIRKKYKYL